MLTEHTDNKIGSLLKLAIDRDASDLHLIGEMSPIVRINGEISVLEQSGKLNSEEIKNMVNSILNPGQKKYLEENLELSFSYYVSQLGRFRTTIYFHKGKPELAIRIGTLKLKTPQELNIPPQVLELARRPNGLVIVTGPVGMGKTTTLNVMIDLINKERKCKIITIEDPIEYVHIPQKAIIVQQEIRLDTHSFSRALVHALRQDPDVICIGEMRDLETISTALTAAETGHLVLATLHTPNAYLTIDRIVNVFPEHIRAYVSQQVSGTLQGIVAQQILPRADRPGRILATEILIANDAVRNLIREGKSYQIPSVMQSSTKLGMQMMEDSLSNLYHTEIISRETYEALKTRYLDMRRIRPQQEDAVSRYF